MKIFNTLSRKKEEFVPLTPGEVKMYVCGPTVYNFIHIGNARPMIVFDTVRRYFEYKGYDVRYVSNFTDVDDKIIKKAIEEGVDADTVSRRYIEECKKDMAAMNVKPATVHPQATQEICGMLEMIQTLIDKNHAYVAGDGTVYFRTGSFKEYGKLSHKNLDELQSGFREIKVTGEEGKEDPNDFVLWKPKKEGEPFWVFQPSACPFAQIPPAIRARPLHPLLSWSHKDRPRNILPLLGAGGRAAQYQNSSSPQPAPIPDG